MLIKISQALDHNFFQDIANLLDNKKCLTTDDKESKKLLQTVQNLDTEKVDNTEFKK